MQQDVAFELGLRTARAGYFFDAMEMVASVAPEAGGLDELRGAIELIFPERDAVNDDMAWVVEVVERAFGSRLERPTSVDSYRTLMTNWVFEIVNRWSYIGDIKQVNRLQAWFYAGFGLGRARTSIMGTRVYDRLFAIAPAASSLPTMPKNLYRMAAEAAKQLDVAAEEDDLRTVRPLLEECSTRCKALSLRLSACTDPPLWTTDSADARVLFQETATKMTLELTTPR